MNYQIQERIDTILNSDKMSDPQAVCEILKDEIKPIVENYLTLTSDIKIRFKKENNKNIFFLEISANRIKPFGYIPY